VIHGGPGSTHHYLDSLGAIAATGRPVIHYDQIGNGASSKTHDKGAEFWSVDLFLQQLNALLESLRIQDRYALLGHSWGGMLAAEHAATHPPGLRALILANAPSSMALMAQGVGALRAALPPEARATLDRQERAGQMDSPDFLAAARVFYDRHVCRVPRPPEVDRSFELMDAYPTIYRAMNGPTEFTITGSLRTWSIVDRVHLIRAPTLVVSGRFDEVTPPAMEAYLRIPGVRSRIFQQSSHMPHVEEPEACIASFVEFLDSAEEGATDGGSGERRASLGETAYAP
jgi:L-proline amide hydrolase